MSPDDPRHGTYAGTMQRCKCGPCRAAGREYVKAWRRRTGKTKRTLVPVAVPGRCVSGLGWPG